MSLGKLPVLKSLVSGAHPKRRQRPELTRDMIGPPLGDFRHTMHVGRGGDAFGDTSFLSEHGGRAASPDKASFFTRTLRHVRRSPLRSRGGSTKSEGPAMYPPPPVSPIIKNAVSLPQLNEMVNGGATERFTYKSTPVSPASETIYPYGLESGFCTIPRLSRQERTPEPSYLPDEPESDTDAEPDPNEACDSLHSFHLDFGPSLMSEVLEGIGISPTIAEEDEEEDLWDYSRGGGGVTNGHGTQLLDMRGGRRAEGIDTHQAHWEPASPSEDTGNIRLNGLSCLATPPAVLGGPLDNSRRDPDPKVKPTPSPRGQRVLWEKERRQQEPAWPATPDCKAEATPRVQPASEWGMRAGQFSRVARVLAHHYGEPVGTASREEEEEEEAGVLQEEEEETGPSALEGGRVYVALQGGSFAYAEEGEEEDDEVKV